MPHQRLTRTLAKTTSIREVCIDSEKDIWVTVRVPSPRVLMEFEGSKEGNLQLIHDLVKNNLLDPKIVETPANDNEVTMDDIGGYFLAIATAILDTADPSGDARKKAESFLANQPSPHGSSGGDGVLHAAVRPSGA